MKHPNFISYCNISRIFIHLSYSDTSVTSNKVWNDIVSRLHLNPWPGRHTDGIQRAQPTLATDGGNRCLAPPHRHARRLRRRGERPWPGSTPHTCEDEGDNTSLARYYTTTPSGLRSRGTTLARHHITATANGSASQIRKFSTYQALLLCQGLLRGRLDNRVSFWNSTLPQLQTTTAAPSLPQLPSS